MSYTDGLKVKISEKYKPPRKINLAMTYSQRLTLNKQIQDNMPEYDFSLEQDLTEKLNEWRSIRRNNLEERKVRLDNSRKEFEDDIKKKRELEKEQEVTTSECNETTVVMNEQESPITSTNNHQASVNYLSNGILMPTQATYSYSNILTPVPLTASQPISSHNFSSASAKRSFNISEFEEDTYSPFDNMELKSINDLEELAQVLKSEHTNVTSSATLPTAHSTYNSHYTSNNYNNQTFTYIPNSYNLPPVQSSYSHTNGYYSHDYPDITSNNMYYTSPLPQMSKQQRSNCKSVPDIVQSVNDEIAGIDLNRPMAVSSRPKSTETVCKDKIRDDGEILMSDLAGTERELCRSIGSMGFPLSRVVRVYRRLGNDQKKIVEHLLTLSELLDLGFSESKISEALIQFDNDKDKALDNLIS